jgi:glycolate dehydrogenase FAD-linked subunit
MNQILEIDTANHVAVVQPGVTPGALDAASAGRGLVYPVYPGR